MGDKVGQGEHDPDILLNAILQGQQQMTDILIQGQQQGQQLIQGQQEIA